MIKQILNQLSDKFATLKTWQKVLIVIGGIIIFPITLLAIWYYSKPPCEDISEILMGQKQDDLEERVENAEKKDDILAAKEEALKVEKETLLKEIENNEEEHSEISKRINGASSIDELRAIARSIRG